MTELTIGMYSFYGNERAICELRMIDCFNKVPSPKNEEDKIELKFRQGSFQRATEADFRNVPVKEPKKKHIIHGSFKELDYLNIHNTGSLKDREVIKDKIKELMSNKQLITERVLNNGSISKEVATVYKGLFISERLFILCKDIRMLIIEDDRDGDCFKLVDMPNLERVEIGNNCFQSVTILHVKCCPKLRRMFIGDGSFTNCTECVIEDNAELLELQFGITAADDEESEEGEEESEERAEESEERAEENEDDAGEDAVEPPNKDDENEEGEEENEEGEEDPSCFQCSTLKLASDFSSVECNE